MATSSSTTGPEDRRQRPLAHRGTKGDSAMFENFRGHIQADDVRVAYDRFLSTPRFALIPKWAGRPGRKRSVAFTRSGEPKGGYYSVIVNMTHLRFYIRKPAWCDEWTEQRDALEARFKERFYENTAGEWCVNVYTIDEVRFLEDLSTNTPYPLRQGKDDDRM